MPSPNLPDILAGHWESDEGSGMAKHYLAAHPTRIYLCGGQYSDMMVAHRIASLHRDDPDFEPRLTMAKDRIRWLSVQLAIANQAPAYRMEEPEPFDLAQAKKEGWTISPRTGAIVRYSGPETRGLPYDGDDQARRVVKRTADGGSEYHRHAMAIALEVEDMYVAQKCLEDEFRLGNLTRLGVANGMRRLGFKLEYATEVANKLESPRSHLESAVRNIIFNVEQAPENHTALDLVISLRKTLGLKPGERP